ncbi:hypothetical protein QIH91_21960 [Bradyrhizobium japonicum USDA 135]|nr:hypothetical protein QIH91_21960 [Bradyrhizobium japonicum USDA 135]
MFDPFSQQGAGELNVLKRHLQSTVLTLLDRNTSQREKSWPRLFGQRPAGFKWIPAGLC